MANRSTTTSATSTNFFSTTASSSNLFTALFNGAGLATCQSGSFLTWSGGSFGCDTDDNTGTFSFTPDTYGLGSQIVNATSTGLWLKGSPLGLIASTTFATNATTTNATTTNLSISGEFDVDNLTSALTLTGAGGIFAEYTGTTCTNQFVRVLSALGVATCATVVAGDVDLADLTATNAALTFAGTYDGQTARTIGLNLANANTWTGGQTFTSATSTNFFSTTASSTNLFASAVTFGQSILALVNQTITGLGIWDLGGATSFEIPNGTGPTVDTTGEIAIDTTTGQLKFFDGADTHIITGTTTKSFNIASTTLDAMGKDFKTGTTTLLLANFPEAMTLRAFYCTASTTGTALVRFGDPTGNYTETSTCTTGGLTSTVTNNTWTAYEGFTVQASSTAGAVSRITVTAVFNKTAD